MCQFFIMMSSQKGDAIMPIVDDDGDVVLFDLFGEAKNVAENNMAAQVFGYEIFQRGSGE